MFRQLLEHSPLLTFPLIGLGLFLTTFIAVVLRTYGKKAEAYAPTAALPLEDDMPRHGGP